MCTGKRQTHIRNAPSSRTAVTGIAPTVKQASTYEFAVKLHKTTVSCRAEQSPRPYQMRSVLVFSYKPNVTVLS